MDVWWRVVMLLLCLVVMTQAGHWKSRNKHKRRQRDGASRPRGHGQAQKLWESAFDGSMFEDLDSMANSFNWFESDVFNPFLPAHWTSRFEVTKPWWQGPNVCENKTEDVQNVTDSGEMMTHYTTNFQHCDLSESAYKCRMIENNIDGRREVTLIYECCHGYRREKGEFGCPKQVEMKNLIDEAQDLGLTEFLKAVQMLELTERMKSGNFTIFAPINGAFGLDDGLINTEDGTITRGSITYLQDAPAAIEVSQPALERTLKTLQGAILGHMVAGARRSSSLNDEQILETGHPEGSTIRVNFFARPEKMMTANCVPVVSRDNMATNGVIHTLEKALKPVTETLLDLVASTPELTMLKTVLAAADYVPTLEEDGQYTLLAPTNGAFRKMNRRLRDRLLTGDRKCIKSVLLNHMLPRVECSAAYIEKFRSTNLLNKGLIFTRTKEDKVFVNDAQVVSKDIMSLNGVMHIIDGVLIPEEALGFLDVLEQEGYTELVDLVETAGLAKTLDKAKDVTLLAPTNEAIQNLPLGLKSRLASDRDLLKKVLTYHVSPTKFSSTRFKNNHLISSLEGRQVRLNRFSSDQFNHFFNHGTRTAQCVPIEGDAISTCNGQLVPLSNVMIPPVGNVMDVLASDKRFSTLVRLIKKAGIAEVLQSDGPFTVLAPNNDAFDKLGKRVLENYLRDTNRLAHLLKSHVFKDNLCCAGIFRHSFFGPNAVRTLSGKVHRLSRSRNGIALVSHVPIVKCDKTANNGNILEMGQVLSSQMSRRPGHYWSHRNRNHRRRRFQP